MGRIPIDSMSTVILNIAATTTVNTPVTISLSGLIKPDASCEVITGTATAIRQNIMYVPASDFQGSDLVEVQCSDGNKVAITVAVVENKATKKQEQQIRTQTRQTSMAGRWPEDRFWTVTEDTGPIEGPSAAFVPLRIEKVTAMTFIEGHPPEHTIDGDPFTYYSTEGAGSWIQFDLGHLCNISEVDISWAQTGTFSLAISTDRKNMVNVYQGRGVGKTNIKMPNASAQLVKITSMSDFMEISDIVIKGSPSTPKPTATGAQAVLRHSSIVTEPGDLVIMDGTDSRGDIIRYVWDQNSSPTVQLFNDKTAVCSFVAPDVESPTTLQYSFTIVDRNGQYSKADILVHIKPKIEEKPKRKREREERTLPELY